MGREASSVHLSEGGSVSVHIGSSDVMVLHRRPQPHRDTQEIRVSGALGMEIQ